MIKRTITVCYTKIDHPHGLHANASHTRVWVRAPYGLASLLFNAVDIARYHFSFVAPFILCEKLIKSDWSELNVHCRFLLHISIPSPLFTPCAHTGSVCAFTLHCTQSFVVQRVRGKWNWKQKNEKSYHSQTHATAGNILNSSDFEISNEIEMWKKYVMNSATKNGVAQMRFQCRLDGLRERKIGDASNIVYVDWMQCAPSKIACFQFKISNVCLPLVPLFIIRRAAEATAGRIRTLSFAKLVCDLTANSVSVSVKVCKHSLNTNCTLMVDICRG